jgi:hypothetical protein
MEGGVRDCHPQGPLQFVRTQLEGVRPLKRTMRNFFMCCFGLDFSGLGWIRQIRFDSRLFWFCLFMPQMRGAAPVPPKSGELASPAVTD